jgi:release factor glutamine methyltransferase
VEGAVVLTDLVSGLEQQLAGRVDVLLFNPPYVPSPPEEVRAREAHTPARGLTPPAQVGGPRLSAAWAGGLHGRVVIDRFLPRVPALLAPGGTLYMVAVSENGVPDLLHQLASLGLTARVALVRTADCERLHILVARRL